ncbi:MAG: protein kinase [Gemmataceae bacterium]|nr:protein kinase [Gemmataceae bacterium]MCI0742960.1 protein kinase [Gemmataceae bacterium]
MDQTVESLCNQLARAKVLSADAIRGLRLEWRAAAGVAADRVADFRQWLLRQQRLTAFQLDMIDRGYGDLLHFGQYKLTERIGRGRMAGVYKGVHSSGQVVAIKVLPPTKAKDPQVLGRFLREARLAVKLDHDNVVRTFQSGVQEDMHFIVMEYLDGDTLDEVLKKRKRLPGPEAVAILIQALEGLEHLNDEGLVHRDLKPGNLMLLSESSTPLTESTANCTVKILDIGLGRALFDEGTPGAGELEITSDGAILGTLDYMAPEQARSAHSADIRADIYSLGCVMYEMLTGKPPFPDTNFARQMRRHAEEAPKPPAETVAGLPPQLNAIVLKMLAKDASMRYATPSQAIKDLRALAAPTPASVKPARPMRSYLSWLEMQRLHQQPGEFHPAPAAKMEQASSPPVVRRAQSPPQTPKPALPQAMPVPSPVAPATSAPAPVVFQVTGDQVVGHAFEDTWKKIKTHGWGKRDWIAAGIGAGAMLLLVFFLWVIWLLAT